jgi:hypothetical protein
MVRNNQILILSAVVLILLACNFLTSQPVQTPIPIKIWVPTPTNTIEPTVMPANTPSLEPASIGSTPVTTSGFTVVRLHPSDGSLPDQLADQALRANMLSQEPYIEFDATWCSSCLALETSLDEGNPLMVAAFQGVYMIRIDIDEWEGLLDGTGFEFEAIPIIFQLDNAGHNTGNSIDGDAWGENIPENMAPPLDAFFHS